MTSIPISDKTLGVNFTDANEATILVWAPEAESMDLILHHQQQAVPLTRIDYGYWSLETPLLQPGDRYLFRINGKNEFPDPASLSQPDGVHGASEALRLTDFEWDDQAWTNPKLDDYIFYEIHTGTFTNEGTFEALEQKLDYLHELGITAIELMPLAQFPGTRNWGYDGVFPYAVQHSYGGAHGLQRLVNACHQRQIAVVLDVVYNHLGPEGNYLGQFGPYINPKYYTPWGGAINFDDAWSDGVRQFVIENVLMWFRDFHIDALRLDAVHALKDFGPVHILQDIRRCTDELMAQTGQRHYLIAELDLNDNKYIAPLEKGGYGLDAQWIDEFHHALRVTAGGERTGYYTDFEGISHLAKAYTDAFVFSGQFSNHRKRFFGTRVDDNPGQQFIVFSQNHDQIGNRMLGERSSQLMSFEMQKTMAAAVILSPFLPFLFMGEEWSEPHPFLYFADHSDPELTQAVRQGRKKEFAAFHAIGEAPDPFSLESYALSKPQWELLTQTPHQQMFQYYKKLIALRKTQPALRHLNRRQLSVKVYAEAETLILHRWHEEQHMICILNFSDQPQPVTFPELENLSWQKILDSSDTQWGGSGQGEHLPMTASGTMIPSQSFQLYTNGHV
ncbi:malto-oligosyltrehalose trehalohydrolase [Arundinibacter roseus]|uniref:Malto-oligosyltrehalose trehalohydrolase n=1 Tax=Arundinibacter roseus TaxID=2070510 RepID=A0A4R4K7U7_9BACT|nr:malto-oligosyltrehalose trehalohydrolase [Arundinibacter roseus]TDB63727.1 malto-oligosyltrehalose trehalohydrolase [Arundinibacter roseus]